MDQAINFITIGVPNLDEARHFYVDTLGYEVALEIPGESVFVQAGNGTLLGLFDAEALEADIGHGTSPAETSLRVTLTTVVDTEQQVIDALQTAKAGGATIIKTPQIASFGGFHAYFADPAGLLWEISTNSGWSVKPSGKVTLRPIKDAPPDPT